MGIEFLKERLAKQQMVYQALTQGEADTVCYREFQNGTWGTDDKNYINRLRLAYYLLYFHIDDEAAVVFLFEEELKDRERNSFQGIGSSLVVLTHLLQSYCKDGAYSDLLVRAKNANFDCACGYDPKERVDDDFTHNSLLDAIYLSEELHYADVMAVLVDEWKETVADWNDSNRRALIHFNQFLDREAENEMLYLKQLADASKNTSAIPNQNAAVISAYVDLIRHYLRAKQYDKAHHTCMLVIETTDYNVIRQRRLFGTILEVCLETVSCQPEAAMEIWHWAKPELQRKPHPGWWYGNLYIKGIAAATAVNDSYGTELEREYYDWKKKLSLS